jgi:hypothetical protein
MITGIYAGGFFAMAADGGEGRVFAKCSNPVILGMIEIIAGNPALLTNIANL